MSNSNRLVMYQTVFREHAAIRGAQSSRKPVYILHRNCVIPIARISNRCTPIEGKCLAARRHASMPGRYLEATAQPGQAIY